MKLQLACLVALFGCFGLDAQTFSNMTSLLNNPAGGSPCVVDMNSDGLDDVVTFSGSNLKIDYQQTDGSFSEVTYDAGMQNNPSWSVSAGDIDGNGYNDLLLGGGSRVSFVYANADGTGYSEVYIDDYIFSQRTNFADIDNDGNLDAFACHDVDQSHPYRNDGNGNLFEDQSLLPTIDITGNYASIFVDFDNDGDQDMYLSKCSGGSSPGQPANQNGLYINNGDGTWTQDAMSYGLFDGERSWVTVFEDFDNDGDFDSYTVNHSNQNFLRENDGTGHYTDITVGSGITMNDLGSWACIGADFDNDGYVDILSESDVNDELYHNNGDFTFTPQNMPFDKGALGDLNNDGFIDVWTGSTLWMNDGNANNWTKVALTGTTSNRNGIGARIEVNGSWGTQIRECRSGENFKPMSSMDVNFGLGSASAITSIVVKWPSGVVDVINNPAINSRLEITEGSGIPTPLNVEVAINVMAEGPYDAATGLMNDNLRVTGVIPSEEPFTAAGYTHVGSGGETIAPGLLDVTGPNAIVDWIFVELRNGVTQSSKVATMPALLRRDGSIVDVNGNANLGFALQAGGSFVVAVRHLGHLGFRNTVATPNTEGMVHTFNMTDGSETLYGSDALNNNNGVWMMVSGEANNDGQINSVDMNAYWRVENGQVYDYNTTKADFNLDGAVNSLDKNTHWRPNSSRAEQLD